MAAAAARILRIGNSPCVNGVMKIKLAKFLDNDKVFGIFIFSNP
jgi:hypothetical protein